MNTDKIIGQATLEFAEYGPQEYEVLDFDEARANAMRDEGLDPDEHVLLRTTIEGNTGYLITKRDDPKISKLEIQQQ